METITVVTYEVIEPVSNKFIVTKSRYEALDWYEKGCMVYERHTTTTQPTTHTQMQSCVTLRWYGDSKKYEV
jgi:hypothetical protein